MRSPDSRESFGHAYNDEQLDYMKNFWKNKNAKLNNEKETTSRLSATLPTQEQLRQKQIEEELRNKKDSETLEAIEEKNKQREEAKKKESIQSK